MIPERKAKPSFSVDAEAERGEGPMLPEERYDESKLTPEAWDVRTAYINERSRWTNAINKTTGRWRPSIDHDGKHGKPSVWQQIATYAAVNEFDATLFVATLSSELGFKRNFPEPKYFLGDVAWTTWLEAQRRQEHAVELAAKIQTQVASAKIGYYQAVGYSRRKSYRITLVDGSLSLSPLFRYCIAVDQGYKDIVKHYRNAAIMQFMQYAEWYVNHWRLLLPPDFYPWAKRKYKELIGHHG